MGSNDSVGRRKLAGEKKTYRRPATLSRETLEVLAVICTDPSSKVDALACPFGTPVS